MGKLALSKAYKAYSKLSGVSARPMPKSETTFDLGVTGKQELAGRA